MRSEKALLVLLCVASLSACGGGSDSGNAAGGTSGGTTTGGTTAGGGSSGGTTGGSSSGTTGGGVGSSSGGSTGGTGTTTIGGTGGGTGSAASSSFTFVSGNAVPVANCPTVTGQTSAWCRSNWPPDASGTVYAYTFTETRSPAGNQFGRLAYVYRPASVVAGAAYPMLVYLHGGTQSGDQLFSTLPFAQLADGRSASDPISWPMNSVICQEGPLGSSAFGLGGTSLLGFISTDGSSDRCTPGMQTFSRPAAAPPFFTVYPNGVSDFSGGGHSWEDGRNPSPGQNDNPNIDINQQQRDDVGFINALIATVKSQQSTLVDATRVYIGGVSNGGIMTTRLLCNMDNAKYPELASIAAFSVSVASMADNLYTGSNGREQCPSSGKNFVPLSIFVGYDSPTPNSNGQPFFTNCNPYNPSNPSAPAQPACPYATVSGDGTVPYGTAFETGGGTYTVNSFTIGNVIASLDNQNFWLNYIGNSGAGSSTPVSGLYGFFTHYKHYSFANSPAVYQVYEIQNGLHLNGGTRFDFSSAARIYDFLFAFKKVNGAPVYIGGSYDSRYGTYGDLDGTY